MKILFYTFPEGHLVSDKEFERLKKGFAKVGMELIRWHKDKGTPPDADIYMVKGWSHTYEQIPAGKKIVYYSIGSEWKVGLAPELNDPIKNLYKNAVAVVHVSTYCKYSHWSVFDFKHPNETVIIPAEEPKLKSALRPLSFVNPLKLATTCIPRPVKRIEQLEELCKKNNIELVPAYGSISDFSYYHDCDGFISLSRKEGMPNCVLEALAYGLPCIVTNYGGSKEAVGDAGVVIRTDPETGPWDPSNIQPVDEILFEQAIVKFRSSLWELQVSTRARVLSHLNDYSAACRFKEVFEALL